MTSQHEESSLHWYLVGKFAHFDPMPEKGRLVNVFTSDHDRLSVKFGL